MKKPTIISLVSGSLVGFGLLLGAVPLAGAQVYQFNPVPAYGAPVCLSLTSTMSFGSTDAFTGGQVTKLQQFLNQTGYLSGVSGTYDQGTLGAVINYQSSHNIPATGLVGPDTRLAINQQSCVGSYNSGYNGYNNGYVAPVAPVYPGISSGQNCTWSGSTYVCSYLVPPVAPVAPIYPGNQYPGNVYIPVNGYCNGYNNSYNYNNGYNNGYNNYQNCGPVVASLSVSYTNSGITMTIKGTGFSPTGNTVHVGATTIPNVVSNGQTLVVTVPTSYQYGSQNVTVTNASGATSNSLPFMFTGYPYNNYGNYNNGYNYQYGNYNNGSYNGNQYGNGNYNQYGNGGPTLGTISGPSAVQAGVTNTWNVTAFCSTNSNLTVHVDWGDNIGSNNSDTQSSYSTNQNFSFTHTYRYAGNYTIRATVTDNSGRTSFTTTTVRVNGGNNYYPW